VWATLVNSGLLLCAVAIVAAVMFGLTWDNTPVEEHDDDNVDVLMLAVMLTVCVWFAGGVVAVAYFARKRRGDELHLSRGPQRGLNATMPYEASPANTCSDRGSAAHLQVSDKL
jgi:heme/copper-type cytochrome/quinol oxidase subunit 2